MDWVRPPPTLLKKIRTNPMFSDKEKPLNVRPQLWQIVKAKKQNNFLELKKKKNHVPLPVSHYLRLISTSILLFQHPSQENQGKEREPPQVKGTAAKTVPELPDPNVNITLAHIANKIPTPS